VSLKAEYFYEELSREVQPGTVDPSNPSLVRTQRVPLGVRYHHPSGVFAEVQETYVDQLVQFPNGAPTVQEFTSRFWLTDLAVGYRLPQRLGIISFEIKNLFNRKFGYQDTDLAGDPRLPLFWPDRLFLAKLNLAW
jgi:outer membrane receptor for monomeric catechols